jgi:NAD(P)-dependent dehydrogenase (short-subunit alcohol dehydrogenase family)
MNNELFSLEGRVALVTGGTKGIGKMIAKGFLQAGARVYINSRNPEQCTQVAKELSEFGICKGLPQDLGSVDGCKALLKQFGESEEKLDILVNNAGVGVGARFEKFTEELWDKAMDLNLKSIFFMTQAAHELLKKAATDHCAKVINITSIDGYAVNAWGTFSYQASKAGAIHITKRLAAQLIKDNIVVNHIAPGAFPTDLNVAARDHAEHVGKLIPAKRVGDELDMAGTAIYLASRAGDYVVGSGIILDGGATYANPVEFK